MHTNLGIESTPLNIVLPFWEILF